MATEAGVARNATESTRPFTLGLCYGTVMDADFHQLVEAGAAGGFDTLTVSPGLYRRARSEGLSDEDLRDELATRGLTVASIDPLIGILPATPPIDEVSLFMRELLSYTEADCLAAAEGLGAPMIAVAHPAGGPATQSELVEVIGPVAARAGERGIGIGVEFISNSQGIGRLEVARGIVADIGAPNVGLILDAWHLFRTGVEMESLADIASSEIALIQLCDAPASAKAERPGILADRLVPGEGDIPLETMLATLVAKRPGVDIGVEVFSAELRQLPAEAAGRRAGAGARRVLAGAGLLADAEGPQ